MSCLDDNYDIWLEIDSGIGRATPPRRAPSPGMATLSRHMPSPSGPGSLPPGLISKRRGIDDGSSDISSTGNSMMEYSGSYRLISSHTIIISHTYFKDIQINSIHIHLCYFFFIYFYYIVIIIIFYLFINIMYSLLFILLIYLFTYLFTYLLLYVFYIIYLLAKKANI